ncbi:cation acetate symporter [Streptomyces sp. NPDC001228]
MSFVAFCAATALALTLCVVTGPDSEGLAEFYTGHGSTSPLRHGLVIAGDYISAVTVLGTGGVIALTGYDGIVLALSTVLSLALAMLLLAEPLRRNGRFTMGDVLARRMPNRSVRVTVGVVTIITLLPVILVQLAGFGRLMAYVLGFSSDTVKVGCVVGIGLLVILYAAIGGMQGTALMEILKTTVLVGSGITVALLVLHRFDWDLGSLFDTAAQHSGVGQDFLRYGQQFAPGAGGRLDMICFELTIVLGVACLPHNTMRVYSISEPRHVRRSMSWAVAIVAVFMLIMVVVEFGATAILGRGAVAESDPQGDTAYLLGTRAVLGSQVSTAGSILFTLVATALLLTVLASVAGMLLACANSLAHDVLASRRQDLSERREIALARWSTLALGLPIIATAALAERHPLLPLASLSFCLCASAITPALVYGLFWRRYTTTGLMATLVGGSVSVLLLFPGTSLVSGSLFSVLPASHFDWFPFTGTGIVSIPVGFLSGWLGTVLPGHAKPWRSHMTMPQERPLTEAAHRRS